MKTKAVKLSDIVIDAGTQQREGVNNEKVEEYAEAIRCGDKMPPVEVFFDGVRYILSDGFHRLEAHKRVEGMQDILAEVHEGTTRDALLASAGANGKHGLDRSNAAKRKAVLVLLLDKEWSQWSDNRIAKHCCVTQPFVSKLRKNPNPTTAEGVITVITPATKPNNDGVLKTETPKKEADDQPQEAEPEDYDERDFHIEQISESRDALAAENAALLLRLASGEVGVTPEEVAGTLETVEAMKARIGELSDENDALRREVQNLTAARDFQMRKAAQLQSQLNYMKKVRVAA